MSALPRRLSSKDLLSGSGPVNGDMLLGALLLAEREASSIKANAIVTRASKVREEKDAAKEEIADFRAQLDDQVKVARTEAKSHDFAAETQKQEQELARVELDYQTNKAETVKYILGRIRDVNLSLTPTQLLSLSSAAPEVPTLPEKQKKASTKQAISAAMEETPQAISTAMEETSQLISTAMEETPQVISTAMEETPEAISTAMEEMPEAISTAMEETPEGTTQVRILDTRNALPQKYLGQIGILINETKGNKKVRCEDGREWNVLDDQVATVDEEAEAAAKAKAEEDARIKAEEDTAEKPPAMSTEELEVPVPAAVSAAPPSAAPPVEPIAEAPQAKAKAKSKKGGKKICQ